MKRFWVFAVTVAVLMVSWLPAMASEMGYDNGFYLKNDESTFKLKITGRIQPRATFNTSSTAQRSLSFSIRRSDLNFAAFIHDKLSFRIGLRHATNSQNFATLNVTGGTITYSFVPQFTVTVGMVGLPLDFMAETSSSWYLLPDAPITMTQSDGQQAVTVTRESFGVPDGLGVNFAGDISKFFYSVSAVNGAESNYAPNRNMLISFGGRFGVNIMGGVGGKMTDFAHSSSPNLTVSVGSMYQGKRTDAAFTTPPEIKNIWTSSLGAGFRWAGLSVQTEGYYRQTRFNSFGSIPAALRDPNLVDIGYYGAVGYYIVPKIFEIAAQAGQIIREGPDNNANQFGGGLNYYIIDNNMKLQLGYTWTQDFDDISGAENNSIHNAVLQLQALF